MNHIISKRTLDIGVRLLFSLAAMLSLGLGVMTTASAATTTTIQFASGVTNPNSGVILNGTAINPATGNPYRHLWYGDFANGLCRLDPDIDTVAPATGRSLNISTCIHFVANFAQFKPGQLAFDPSTNDIYAVDIQAKTQGIIRMHFLPGGDSGHGLLDPVHQEVLGGFNSGCGLPGNVPDTAALGPDGNLYVGFKRSGNIVRVVSPQTEPLPCANVQVIGTTADQRKDFGLGWIGHDLFGGDGNTPWVINNADQCFTAANNFTACPGNSILGGVIAAPSAVISDQTYSGTPTPPGQPVPNSGTTLYYANPNSVIQFKVLPTAQLNTSYAIGFQFVSGLAIDQLNPASPVLYVGDDPTRGLMAGQGRWWQVTNQPPPPAAPGAPTGVTATAGNAQATVGWTPGAFGSQPTSSYTVHTLTPAGTASAVPDVVVTAPAGSTSVPTTATVTGLTNGTSYEFTVQATNSVGTSPASLASNVVVPAVPTPPSAPTGVTALAGNTQASVAWVAPTSSGGSPITGYTVTVYQNGVATGQTVTAPAGATGATVTGLANGTTYTFTVHATNAAGNSPESAPSNAISPLAAAADLSLAMTGPATLNVGANATYTLTATNLGPSTAPQVIVTDTLPSTGVTLLAKTPSQGVCSTTGASVSCNLGSLPVNASATVTITLGTSASGTLTNSASVAANDATGLPLSDPNPANNSASVSTAISGSTTPATTTDVQVTGSASNGGPAAGSFFTYTWQVKNGGSQTANGVTFSDTLPVGVLFESVSSSMGTCSGPGTGTQGGTVNCALASLGVGQTMLVTINVQAGLTPGTISNSASASFNGTDTNPANNSFSVSVGIK